MATSSEYPREDYSVILDWVEPGASVLDLGCGAGELLYLLIKLKGARGQGIEISEGAIYECVEKGLNVSHGDIDSGLADYPDSTFDFVILNQSLQQTVRPGAVLSEAMRAGKKAIVGFPNFANFRARWQLAVLGRAPVTPALPYRWHDTPNLHFLSISDFTGYCRKNGIMIEKSAFTGGGKPGRAFPNLFAGNGLFVISKAGYENSSREEAHGE